MGFFGKVLRVDLSTGRSFEEEVSEEEVVKLVGGRGLGALLLLREVGPGVEPLSPENKLIFATSPLVATGLPTATRCIVVTKSPLTKAYSYSVAGSFGHHLRGAGVDVLIVEGRAQRPSILVVEGGRARLLSAEWLWGMPTSEAVRLIKEALGPTAKAAA